MNSTESKSVRIEMPDSGTVYTATTIVSSTGEASHAVVSFSSLGIDSTITAPATATPKPCSDIATILRTLHEPGSVFEIRALECPERKGSTYKKTYCGYFDDVDKAAAAITDLAACEPVGVYVTLNPLDSDLLSRCCNRVDVLKNSTSDTDVVRRRWLFIDVDPERKSGISSTDAEREAARVVMQAIKSDLAGKGWPEPLVCSSGNGWHLLFRIDLPNDDTSRSLIERFLKGLAEKHDTAQAKIDTSVHNAARITRCYGTVARKGDSTATRPHRRSAMMPPAAPLGVVPMMMLEMVAIPEPPPMAPAPARTATHSTGSTFDIDNWLSSHNVPVGTPTPYKGGRRWRFTEKPPLCSCDWKTTDAIIVQGSDGVISAQCSHSRCSWKWQDLRQHYQPGCYERKEVQHDWQQHNHKPSPRMLDDGSGGTSTLNTPKESPFKPMTVRQVVATHKEMRPPIIDGLLRVGEVCNVIASPKVGKSYFVSNLCWAAISGQEFLGFETVQRGEILILDNELHMETFAARQRAIMERMQILEAYADSVHVVPLRGKRCDIHDIRAWLLETYRPGDLSLVIIDAFYKALPQGIGENDNSQMMQVYAVLDEIADTLQCAVLNIHHASKGEQGSKRVTDVGAGAGSISRAADTHIVIRPHQQDGYFVLEAVTRSFPQPEKITIHNDAGVWQKSLIEPVVATATPATATKRQQELKDDCERLKKLLVNGTTTITKIRNETGWRNDKVKRLLADIDAVDDGGNWRLPVVEVDSATDFEDWKG